MKAGLKINVFCLCLCVVIAWAITASAQEKNTPIWPIISEAATKGLVLPLDRGPVTDNGATPWFANLNIGTPAQTIRFMIDTGTAHNWQTASSCTTAACKKHHGFDPSKSSTFKWESDTTKKPHAIDLGPWGTMKVYTGKDYLSWMSPSLKDKPFQISMFLDQAVYYSGANFSGLACDGGIGIPAIPSKGKKSSELLMLLKKQGLIEKTMVSFWFDAAGKRGEAIFGAVDPKRYDSSSLQILEMKVYEESPDLWPVPLNSFDCGDTTVLSNSQLILDTGSSRFKGDKNFIEKIKKTITQNGKLPEAIHAAKPDFQQYPILHLSIGAKKYDLAPRQYFLEVSPGVWKLAFYPMEGLEGVLLVGSVFLDSVYCVFSYEENEKGRINYIGLADRH